LLFATGGVHLDLYVTGYRSIPTIGALFLLQVISAFGLALAVLVTGRRVAATAGAGFSLATLSGYLVSLRTPLFGFREVRTDAGIAAGVIEVVGFAALAALALVPSELAHQPAKERLGRATRVLQGTGTRWLAGALVALAGLALALSLHATSRGPSNTGASSARLGVTTIGGVAVLTDAQGLTLYWFSQDSPTTSACTNGCTAYWPPDTGTPTAGPGVHGTLGTVHRSDGTVQATFDGHPLYRYIGDAGPGENNGNMLILSGGTWHEMPASQSAS
jgi:predicted lipoprotein with Yx(FWY)xxD motif